MSTKLVPSRFVRTIVPIVLIGGLALVAGCSSSSSAKGSDDTKRTTTTSTTPPSTEASTTSVPAAPPCTIDAATAALPPGTRATGIICAGGFAAGPDTNGQYDAAYLLLVDGGTWRTLTSTETELACGDGNAMQIPAGVLAQSPCKVS